MNCNGLGEELNTLVTYCFTQLTFEAYCGVSKMSACTLFKLKLGTGSCAFNSCSKLEILVNCRMFCISVCTGFMYVSLYICPLD